MKKFLILLSITIFSGFVSAQEFYVDKELYFNFKNEKINNSNFEIPELFKKDFIILSSMDEDKLLNTKNELYEYINRNNNHINNDEIIYNELLFFK